MVESNAKLIVDAIIEKKKKIRSYWGMRVTQCFELMKSLGRIVIQWVRRLGNEVAEVLPHTPTIIPFPLHFA